MGALIGLGFVVFFSLVNAFLWGDGGYNVHLLGAEVPAYSLVWFWIGLITVIFGFNYAIDGKGHNICHIIAAWWVANIGMTTILNEISFRGIEEAGPSIFGLHGLVLDFLAQGALDLASLVLVWVLVRRTILRVSIWTLAFCGYLVANLFGHASGAYNLMIGADVDIVAQSYDSYMYLVFTLMLLFQATGSGLDAAYRWSGSNVDLYADIRGYIYRAFNRDLHLG